MHAPSSPPSPSPHTGALLGGRYRLGEILGRGGWGAVYAATQEDLGRRVAVKVLHGGPDRSLDQEILARFVREARAAAALGHPNIVQIIDFQANANEPPFLVMEHLTGSSLGALLRRERRLPAARVAAIAHQALSALDAAHRAGIVHRDVKPDNLFLVSAPGVEDFVKLLDFGIAKLSSESATRLTAADTMLGTPAFMAPEQIVDALVEAPADLYALGATMYFALTGTYPFGGSNVTALLYAIAHTKPKPLLELDPSIDPDLALLVERAMHKDPRGRFASAEQMRAALEPWVLPGGVARDRRAAGAVVPFRPSAHPATADTLAAPGHPTATSGGSGPRVGPPSPTPAGPAFGTPGVAPALPRTSSPIGVVVVIGVLFLLLAIGGGGLAYLHLTRSAGTTAATNAPASGVAPPATTTAPPGAATVNSALPTATASSPPSGSRRAVATADAGPPKPPAPAPARERMTGRSPRISGAGGFEDITLAAGKAEIMRIMPAIAACHVATELDPPNHESSSFVLEIEPSGAIKDVRTFGKSEHPKHEACVFGALRQTRWPATKSGAKSAKVFFTAKIEP